MNYKRTDLAIEENERLCETAESVIEGIKSEESEKDGIKITKVTIEGKEASKNMSKPEGTYVTLEYKGLSYSDRDEYENLCRALKETLEQMTNFDIKKPVLVIGLGNRNITADSLGPKSIEQIFVTRHLFENLPEAVDENTASVCAAAPGVLGLTGIETVEIVKGIAERVKPGLIIVIDSLAARKSSRINATIQIADSGISPGSGVGNNRKELSRATLGADVIAIGVPTVVDATTLANDTVDIVVENMKRSGQLDGKDDSLKTAIDKQYSFVREVLASEMGNMVLTPKEVDLAMDKISKVVANGVNLFLQKDMSLGDIESFAL